MSKFKIFTNNWVVTLTATLIGVFVALYLNENVSSNKLKNQKEVATKNILLEIKQNKESIEKNIVKHKTMSSVIKFLDKHINEDNQLIISADSMQVFTANYPKIFAIKDSTLLDNGKYHYKGELNLNFDLSYMNLTSISWETLKNSGLSTSFDFNCLMFLEKLDILTKEILSLERKVLDKLWNPHKYDKDNFEKKLITDLDFLINLESGLLGNYNNSKEKLKNCD